MKKKLIFLLFIFFIIYSCYYLNLNLFFFKIIVILHKIFLLFFKFFFKILNILFDFFSFVLSFIWFLLFDQVFFFIIEFFQNPYLLFQRLVKIFFGNFYLKFKYFIVLNYYYYFFVPEFWTDKIFWNTIINNYNVWPNDLRVFLIIFFLCFFLQSLVFFIYLVLYSSYNYLEYFKKIKINLFFFNFFFNFFKSYFNFFKRIFYINLTNFISIDDIYFNKFIPSFIKKYFIFLENYLEFSGVSVKYGDKKKKISAPSNFVKNFNKFNNSIWLKYSYFPILILNYKYVLFKTIIVEHFFRKGIISQKFLYQVVSNINPVFINLRTIILPLRKKFINLNYTVHLFEKQNTKIYNFSLSKTHFLNKLYKKNIFYFWYK